MRTMLLLVAAALLYAQTASSCPDLAFSCDIQASQVRARQSAAQTNLCSHRAVLYCTVLHFSNLTSSEACLAIMLRLSLYCCRLYPCILSQLNCQELDSALRELQRQLTLTTQKQQLQPSHSLGGWQQQQQQGLQLQSSEPLSPVTPHQQVSSSPWGLLAGLKTSWLAG
jgi:hypothetical protein